MSRHFGQRPLLISALVGIGIDALGNRTLEDALPAVKNPNDLSGLHLEELPSLGLMFQQALRGEERYGLTLYGNMPASLATEGSGILVDTSVLSSLQTGPMAAFFRVFILDSDAYLALMDNVQSSSMQPYYKVRDQLPDVVVVSNGVGSPIGSLFPSLRGRQVMSSFGPHGLLTSILIPSLSKAFETLARGEAGDACAQTAVAMTRFRLDHGTLPSHLADLVPTYLDAVPIDPFDGHPLRLAIRNGQWIIYSVGPDGVDDGGVEMVNGKGDVIFTLKSSATRATSKP